MEEEEEALRAIVFVVAGLTSTVDLMAMAVVTAAVVGVDNEAWRGSDASRHWLRLLIGLGFVGGDGGGSEPHVVCRPSLHPLFYISQGDEGPLANGLSAPDQGAGQGPLVPLGQGDGDLSNRQWRSTYRCNPLFMSVPKVNYTLKLYFQVDLEGYIYIDAGPKF